MTVSFGNSVNSDELDKAAKIYGTLSSLKANLFKFSKKNTAITC